MKRHKQLRNTTGSVSTHAQLRLHPERTYSWGQLGDSQEGEGPCREFIPLWGNLDAAPKLIMPSYDTLTEPKCQRPGDRSTLGLQRLLQRHSFKPDTALKKQQEREQPAQTSGLKSKGSSQDV